MKRVRITAKGRADIFLSRGGTCHLCNMKVTPGEEWDVSHDIPLETGGKDDATNWFVAHRKCHRVHTSNVDMPLIAKVKRVHQNHIGAKLKSRNPLPGSKGSKWKKRMDGTVVRREP